MELRHLRDFVAVAEECHFRRAAERLGISQPPLSQQIQALEQELDVKLFIRSKRSVSLTEAGVVFLNRARGVLASAEAAAIEATQLGRGELGALVIGFMSSAMLGRLSQLLRTFRANSPGVCVQLRQLSPMEQMAAVTRGEVDLGFVTVALPSGRQMSDATAIRATPVWEEELVAAVPLDHSLAKRREIPLRALARDPFITLQSTPTVGYYDRIVELCQKAGFDPEIAQQVEQLPAAMGLIAAGYGIGVMPVCVRTEWASEVAFPSLQERPRLGVTMIWRDGNPSRVLTGFRALIDAAKSPPFYAA